MTSKTLFQDLRSFSDFASITDDKNFRRVPDDWMVIITDVKGSTKAIEAGQYKDVNTVGAAAIVAAQNAMEDTEYPFVFGGDGATLIIPPESFENVKKELISLKRLSISQFGLELRVGKVDVSEIVSEGGLIEVAKFELVAGRSVGIFRGGGLTIAEEKIKGQAEKYDVDEVQDYDADLEGLSCRWQPIPNKRGGVLSMLVVARTEDDAKTYQKILGKLNELFEGGLDDANPVNIPAMSYKSIGQCYRDERRYHAKFSFKLVARVAEIIAAVLIFKFKLPLAIGFKPDHYANAMRTHSDYRKFDDMLRMIIDCSPEQIMQIRGFLDPMYQSGEIFYGLHESDKSLMTCYVQSVDDGGHIHFIDGGDGGYAMAAKQLKGQLKSA